MITCAGALATGLVGLEAEPFCNGQSRESNWFNVFTIMNSCNKSVNITGL